MNLTRLTDYELRHLVTHLVTLGRQPLAATVLTRLDVLVDHVVRIGIDPLLADFAAVDGVDGRLSRTADALRDAAHVLRDDPGQLPAQLVARLHAAEVHPDLADQLSAFDALAWLCPLEAGALAAPPALVQTIATRGLFVDAVGLSPDGRVLSGDRAGTVTAWDAASGVVVGSALTLPASITGVGSLGDGTAVASADDGTVIRWDERRGLILGRTRVPPASAFLQPTGHDTAFVGHVDGRVTALNAITLSIRWVAAVSDDAIHALALAPDGSLLCGSRSGAVRIVDAANGVRRQELVPIPTRLHAVAALPDGTVVAGGKDGMLYLFPEEHGRGAKPLRGHHNQIRAIAVTGRPHEVVTASYDGTVLVWDLRDRVPRLLGRHPNWVLALATAPWSSTCAAGSADGTIRLWRTDRAAGEPKPTARGVRAVAAAGDGARVAAVGPDRTLRLFDPVAGRTSARRRLPGRDLVQVAITPDGRAVIATSYDGSVWRLSTNDAASPLRLGRHTRGADTLALTPDGRFAVTAGRDATLRIWGLEGGDGTAVIEDEEPFVKVAVSGDGTLLAAADWSDRISLYARRSGRLLRRLGEHRQTVSALTFTPRGQRILSGSWDGAVTLWEPAGTKWSIEHDKWVTHVSVLPTGRTAVAGYADGTLRLLELRRGRVVAELLGHTGFVTAIAVTGGDLIASAASDRTIRMWSVLRRQQLCAFAVADGVECLTFALDGRTIVAGDRVGHLAAYRLVARR
ncbi:WD40 repeat domain-containing protein [Geodermatophilus poikilotrophus]|uniref:WD40 repeat n=1 Tax=Geodermatophilus poikilotrophus TaxID=1333667 RepID=A0A1I0E2K8_9ACTN|nr:WD40 repeat domain-containing protein [Geodermatophilus poikilotrophus]SET39204.1 WD40 repeat [Geodermatophilus poikilotrophus]